LRDIWSTSSPLLSWRPVVFVRLLCVLSAAGHRLGHVICYCCRLTATTNVDLGWSVYVACDSGEIFIEHYSFLGIFLFHLWNIC